VEQALLAALSWDSTARDRGELRSHIFPSWSWADWNASHVYFEHSKEAVTVHEPTLRDVQFEGQDGKTLEPTITSDSLSSRDNLQQALDTVIAILFDALVLPARFFQRKEPKCAGGMDISAANYNFAGRKEWTCPHSSFQDMEVVIKNFNSGIWSPLLLGKHGTPERHRRFILIVQWKDVSTAERLAPMFIESSDDEDAVLRPLEEGLEWRRVRLI
jgi:hypothetical protein